MITVLYVKQNSIYTTLNTDYYTKERDARSYKGNSVIIAHPPCRAWGNYHKWAKPREGEKELAIEAIKIVRSNGGIVEHPKNSKLWKTMNIPNPGQTDEFGGWLLNIDQYWFGHRAQKNTTLYINGITPMEMIPTPLKMGKANITVENMGRAERERTPTELAKWLIEIATIIHNKKQTK